jgi:hypothetical protein
MIKSSSKSCTFFLKSNTDLIALLSVPMLSNVTKLGFTCFHGVNISTKNQLWLKNKQTKSTQESHSCTSGT